MKLIEFGSRYIFNDWFYRGNRSHHYPLIDLSYRHYWEEDTHIYRAVEKGKDIGIIFISCCYPGEMWIDLFEVRDDHHRKGIGTEMFNILMEKHKPLHIKLECVEEYDKNNQEAHKFWRKMGFHKTKDRTVFGDAFVKTYTKKYWENYD